MSVTEYELTVHPFEMDVPKRAALKPLEEAAEAFVAWQALERAWAEYGDALQDSDGTLGPFDDSVLVRSLADEIADVVQAACNLAARHGIDMAAAMERCEARNRWRGRYGD